MKLLGRVKKQAALAVAVSMVLGMQATTMANDFSSHWAQDVIAQWSEYGVVEGYEDGSFKPNNSMTRAEFAVVLSNVFGLVDMNSSQSFADVKPNAWYADAVSKVSAAGMMQGANGKFQPSAPITRQEAAVALANAYNLTETGSKAVSFTDSASIAKWASEQVKIMASNGYITGRIDGRFDPKANITRAEILKIFDNMTAALFNKAGIYTQDAKGNVIVNVQDVVLKNMTISGALYLAQGINLGDAALENVTVEGNIYASGGGVNSIRFNHVNAKKPVHIKTPKTICLVSENGKIAVTAEEGQKVILTGTFSEVRVSAGSVLELKGATVDRLIVEAAGSKALTLKMDSTSTVKELIANAPVNISGTGKITKLTANVAGVKTEINPTIVEGQQITVMVTPPTSSSSGNGSSQVKDQEYIKISSVKVDGEEMYGKGIAVNNAAIDINIEELTANYSSSQIQGACVKVDNLKAGTQVTATAQAGRFPVAQSCQITSSGELLYTVNDGTSFLAGKANTIIGALEDAGLYEAAENVANKLGYSSVKELLKRRDSLNVNNLKAGFDFIVSDDEDAQTIREFLGSKGFTITDSSISFQVTLSAEGLVTRSYTVNVRF